MRPFIREFWHCYGLSFFGSVMIKDWVHGVGHSPVGQILLQIVVRSVIYVLSTCVGQFCLNVVISG